MEFSKESSEKLFNDLLLISNLVIYGYLDLLYNLDDKNDANADVSELESFKSKIEKEMKKISSLGDKLVEVRTRLYLFDMNRERRTSFDEYLITRINRLLSYKELENNGFIITYGPKNTTLLSAFDSYYAIMFIESYIIMQNQALNETTDNEKENFNITMKFLNETLLGEMITNPMLEKIIFSFNDKVIIDSTNEELINFLRNAPTLLDNNETNFNVRESLVSHILIQLRDLRNKDTNELAYKFKFIQLELTLSYLSEESLNKVKKDFDSMAYQFKNYDIRQEVESYFVKHFARVKENN